MSSPNEPQPTLPDDPQPTTPVPGQQPGQPTTPVPGQPSPPPADEPPADEPPLQEPPVDDPSAAPGSSTSPVPGEGLVDVDAQRPSGQDQAPVDVPRTAADSPEMLGAPAPQGGDGVQRDPEDWVTGDDPATEAQKSFLDVLAREAGEQIPADGLTKAQASEHIDRLQAQTGRGPRQS